MDDNPLRGLAWRVEPVDGSAASMLQVVPVGASGLDAQTNNYTGVYALRTTTALNYEALPDQGRLALALHLTDGGQYGFNRQQRQVHALGRDHAMLMVEVAGNVTDVNEPIALRVASTASVREDATERTRIVAVEVVDPDEDVGTETKLISELRSVPASLAPALTLANFTSISDNRSRWYLEVANASLLENAGDGRTFELEIMVAENRTANPTRASARLALTVTDVVHPFVPPDLSGLMLNLSEQQALDASSGSVLQSELFSFSADVQKDYDEFWFGRLRAVDAQARAGAIRYLDDRISQALVDEDRFNLLDVGTRSDMVDLLLGETRLIEDKLIGNRIEFMVELMDPSGAVPSAMLPVPVAILPADAPDRVRFADARGFGIEVPSAYTFTYTQSDYAPALSGSVCDGADPAANISIDGNCYAAVRLEDGGYYVRRDRRTQRYFGPADAALRNGTSAEIGLVFTEAEVNISALGIYALDGRGSLRAADTEFNRYFELAVDQHYAGPEGPRPALVVRPRELAVFNSTTNQSYLALDTLPLNRAVPRRSLPPFFVVAVEEGGDVTNATQRAIAQLNFQVEAANLNVPATVDIPFHFLTFFQVGFGTLFTENGMGTDLGDVVSAPRDILPITVHNPDGLERNQSVTVTVDVVASRGGDSEDAIRADFGENVDEGVLLTPAYGTNLIRLGETAEIRHVINIPLGSDRAVARTLPFWLARNSNGGAFVRVRSVERDAAGVEVENRAVYYRLLVTDDPGAGVPRAELGALAINELSSPIGENVLDALTAQDPGLHLNMTLTLPLAAALRNHNISQVIVTGQSDVLRVVDQPTEFLAAPDRATKVFRQALAHTTHQHGPTRFNITVQVSEPRGFDNQPFALSPLLLFEREVVVRSQNDPLRVVCDANNATDNCGYRSARYRLRRDFGSLAEINRPARSPDEVVLYFQDVDVISDGMAALPDDVRFTHAGPQPFANTTINLVNGQNFAVPSSALQIARVAPDRTDIEVRFPVHLNLTDEQYAGLAARGGEVELNFMVNATDRDAPDLFVLAPARLRIRVSANNTLAALGGYAGGTAVLRENAPVGTNMSFGSLNLTDADITRASGETYTYGLEVTRGGQPIPDLLRWSHGPRETLQRQASSRIQRSIQTTWVPDDADVGDYLVNWSIHEEEGAQASDRLVASDTFTLRIENVDDPVVVFCDRHNATADCGYQGG